jgi:hypothetical protein
MTARVCAVVLLLLATPTTGRLASGQTWFVDSYAGKTDYKGLSSLVSSGAGVTARYRNGRREFQASVGLPLTDKDVPWGAVAVGDRFAIRRGGLTAGVDTSALVHIQRDPVLEAMGDGFQAEGLPTVSQSFGPHLFEVRSGPRFYRASIGDVAWTRTLWTTELRSATLLRERLFLEGGARHDRNRQGEAYTRLGFRAAATLKTVDLEWALGHWVRGVDAAKPEWDLSLAVPISATLSVFTSAQYENFNPQFLGPPRTNLAAGLTYRIGGRRTPIGGSRTPQVHDALEVLSDNRVVIRIPFDESPSAYVAGDFNGWVPEVMTQQGDAWVFRAKLAPGVYRFAFRTASGEWFVPKSVPSRTNDGMGGWVATLVVP